MVEYRREYAPGGNIITVAYEPATASTPEKVVGASSYTSSSDTKTGFAPIEYKVVSGTSSETYAGYKTEPVTQTLEVKTQAGPSPSDLLTGQSVVPPSLPTMYIGGAVVKTDETGKPVGIVPAPKPAGFIYQTPSGLVSVEASKSMAFEKELNKEAVNKVVFFASKPNEEQLKTAQAKLGGFSSYLYPSSYLNGVSATPTWAQKALGQEPRLLTAKEKFEAGLIKPTLPQTSSLTLEKASSVGVPETMRPYATGLQMKETSGGRLEQQVFKTEYIPTLSGVVYGVEKTLLAPAGRIANSPLASTLTFGIAPAVAKSGYFGIGERLIAGTFGFVPDTSAEILKPALLGKPLIGSSEMGLGKLGKDFSEPILSFKKEMEAGRFEYAVSPKGVETIAGVGLAAYALYSGGKNIFFPEPVRAKQYVGLLSQEKAVSGKGFETRSTQSMLVSKEVEVPRELVPLAQESAKAFDLTKVSHTGFVSRTAGSDGGLVSSIDVVEVKPSVLEPTQAVKETKSVLNPELKPGEVVRIERFGKPVKNLEPLSVGKLSDTEKSMLEEIKPFPKSAYEKTGYALGQVGYTDVLKPNLLNYPTKYSKTFIVGEQAGVALSKELNLDVSARTLLVKPADVKGSFVTETTVLKPRLVREGVFFQKLSNTDAVKRFSPFETGRESGNLRISNEEMLKTIQEGMPSEPVFSLKKEKPFKPVSGGGGLDMTQFELNPARLDSRIKSKTLLREDVDLLYDVRVPEKSTSLLFASQGASSLLKGGQSILSTQEYVSKTPKPTLSISNVKKGSDVNAIKSFFETKNVLGTGSKQTTSVLERQDTRSTQSILEVTATKIERSEFFPQYNKEGFNKEEKIDVPLIPPVTKTEPSLSGFSFKSGPSVFGKRASIKRSIVPQYDLFTREVFGLKGVTPKSETKRYLKEVVRGMNPFFAPKKLKLKR